MNSIIKTVIVLGAFLGFILIGLQFGHLSSDPWVWIGVFLTLCIFSFLYRDNPFYKIGEHIFVGVTNAWSLVFAWSRVIKPVVADPFMNACRQAGSEGFSAELFHPMGDANFLVVFPLLIGLLYLTRFIPGRQWMVRIPIGILMGYYTALAVPAVIEGQLFPQMKDTILTGAVFDSTQGGGLWPGVEAVLILIGVLTTLTYFFFSKEHKGWLKGSAQTGIVFVMVAFGASFGFTVMARVSLAIGRFVFLMKDWLGIAI